MTGKPLTSEAIAMTEKKMDMALDDIIKMSKPNNKHRAPNRSQNFISNATVDKSLKLRRFMDSKSSLRQGALAQRRSNFQGNQFPLAVEAARKAANAPIWNRTFNRNRTMNMNMPRIAAPAAQRWSANRGFPSKHQLQKRQQQQQQQQQHAEGVSKQKPQTLDSLFANMKEQRMKVLHQQNGSSNGRPPNNGPPAALQNGYGRPNGPVGQQNNGYGRRPNGPVGQHNGFRRYNNGPAVAQQNGNGNGRRINGPGQQRPRPPWGRYND